MAQFVEVPGRRPLSNTTVAVNGHSLTFALELQGASAGDMHVVTGGDGTSVMDVEGNNDIHVYTLSVNPDALATRTLVRDTIYATADLSKPPADLFKVEFRFHAGPARTLVVRDVTRDIFGVDNFAFLTGPLPAVLMSTFKPGDQGNVLDFTAAAPGPAVFLRVFAAKLGHIERTYWLMTPAKERATSLMIVISHGFGQNHAYYSRLNYGDPMSKALLVDVRNRFVLQRWGHQVATTRPSMALLMPVRCGGAGGELGPFVSNRGTGASIVAQILARADAFDAMRDVNLVTFSSGIFDTNAFIAIGGKGLDFNLMVNQDPSLGANIGGTHRKQYLSGWTAKGPRPGFEFLPIFRWQHDPKFEEMKAALGREYLHTWALPTYTLGMALRS